MRRAARSKYENRDTFIKYTELMRRVKKRLKPMNRI